MTLCYTHSTFLDTNDRKNFSSLEIVAPAMAWVAKPLPPSMWWGALVDDALDGFSATVNILYFMEQVKKNSILLDDALNSYERVGRYK